LYFNEELLQVRAQEQTMRSRVQQEGFQFAQKIQQTHLSFKKDFGFHYESELCALSQLQESQVVPLRP
jgi:hypothetical protein